MGSDSRTLAAIRGLLESVPAEAVGPPHVRFKHMGIQPPARFYITQSEFLVVKVLSSVANPALTITSRMVGPDGQVCRNFDVVGAVSAGVLSTQRFKLGEGFLLDVCVSAFGTTVQRGQCFVSVGIQFGEASGQTPFMCLAADYVTNTMPVTYPGGLIRSSVDGPGFSTSILSSVPGAGAEISFTVPAGQRIFLRAVSFGLVNSVAAANRQTQLIMDDGTNIVAQSVCGSALVASTTYIISALSGAVLTNGALSTIVLLPFPDAPVMAAGWRLRTLTGNLQAGDQYTAMRIAAEQWVEA